MLGVKAYTPRGTAFTSSRPYLFWVGISHSDTVEPHGLSVILLPGYRRSERIMPVPSKLSAFSGFIWKGCFTTNEA